MLRWLADENFNNDILRGLFRAKRDLDIVRAQDAGLTGTGDEALLAWAADQNRVLLTHDVSTITAHAYRRVMKGDRMPGVFEVSRRVTVGAPSRTLSCCPSVATLENGKAKSGTFPCGREPEELSAFMGSKHARPDYGAILPAVSSRNHPFGSERLR